MNAAILEYRKLTKYFTDRGFKMMPFDPYMWNKTTNGSQFTIAFYLDNLKSHVCYVNATIVSTIIKKLWDTYINNHILKDELMITGGRVHENLEMIHNLQTNGEICVTIFDYVMKLIKYQPVKSIGNRRYPLQNICSRQIDNHSY